VATDTKYSKKQLTVMMEQYTRDLLRPQIFSELPLKFKYELSRFRDDMSCHLRTTQGIVMQVDELVAWFEKLPEDVQAEIVDPKKAATIRKAATF
jgi:hypothetical protein